MRTVDVVDRVRETRSNAVVWLTDKAGDLLVME